MALATFWVLNFSSAYAGTVVRRDFRRHPPSGQGTPIENRAYFAMLNRNKM